MHDLAIIPHHHVSWLFPLNCKEILRLDAVVDHLVYKIETLGVWFPNDTRGMSSDIECIASIGCFLNELVISGLLRSSFMFCCSLVYLRSSEPSRMP